MLNCQGYHGTDQADVDSILTDGYLLSAGTNEWLGSGVYFWGDWTGISGLEDARLWVTVKRPRYSWAILEVTIQSDFCLDLLNREGQEIFAKARTALFAKHQEFGYRRQDFKEAFIFEDLCKRKRVEVIRALTDGFKKPEYETFFIQNPQVQICVRNDICIKSNRLVELGTLENV